MFMMPMPSALTGVTTLSLVTSATSTEYNGTITFPSGIEAGDIIIVGQQYGDTDTTAEPNYTSYTGTGFTSVGSGYDPGIDWVYQHAVSYKVADGTEASAAIGGFMPQESGSDVTAAIVVYRPNYPATTVAAQDITSAATTGNPAAQVINASNSSYATICVGHAGGNNTPSVSWSGTPDVTVSYSTGAAEISFRAEAATQGSGADITFDVGDTGSNHATSFYLEVY